jgi:hypothetical protein
LLLELLFESKISDCIRSSNSDDAEIFSRGIVVVVMHNACA